MPATPADAATHGGADRSSGSSTETPGRGASRAAALPAEQRRAHLVAATLPLVLAHGRDISTRAIARAAGVAEGTIFRVFASKDELVDAAVQAAFDPAQAVREISAIDRSAPLEQRLGAAVRVLQGRLAGLQRLLDALGGQVQQPRRRPDYAAHAARLAPVTEALSDLLAPDRDRLRRSPEQAARLLRAAVFAGTHPFMTEGHPLSDTEIVDLLLHGLVDGEEH